ncbi:fam-c protein [Plasmodium yoelii]|uniref:Fam-c protein n=3 Tax=Plasmodium yoelii TaxID=5861 RepID=A0AAE9WW32_PLAYO|nr:fam-c protein [Plasmodium yoelii]EAA20051.1 hypothetical protein [Plasmodium yoelii yoelii]WBY57634.1 fam-c protein [Plasmodium yoelii yoelii]CDU18236.1 fam-c protein [Plasmodium yoelii]VTZ78653.1 fam-c protein [Plasmodium yoelii]|eukprot:XP_022812300.1 fam-c protein [Plasmodium yoelii]
MNKRIFSLVCITLYTLLAVSIYCSEQNVSDLGNKSVRGTKETNISNEEYDIESKRETQLMNNNSKDDEGDSGFNCFNIFKRNKKNKRTKVPLTHSCNQTAGTSSNNNALPMVTVCLGKFQHAIPATDPNLLEVLLQLKGKLEKRLSNKNKSIPKKELKMQKKLSIILAKKPELLWPLLRVKEELEKESSNNNSSIPKVTLVVKNMLHEIPVKDPEHLEFFLRLKEELENYHQIENQENYFHIIIVFK